MLYNGFAPGPFQFQSFACAHASSVFGEQAGWGFRGIHPAFEAVWLSVSFFQSIKHKHLPSTPSTAWTDANPSLPQSEVDPCNHEP